MNIAAKQKMQEASIAMTVIRADGTREELGVVSFTHRRWWRRMWWTLVGAPQASKRIRQANRRSGQ